VLGKSLAHFEIVDLLGKGGMGEVYRARDTKLGREVALKILPKEMSGDAERAARFEREARTLATLQHPNVASIYGFDEVDNVRFLVMELVEGQDLSQRLAAGPLPLEETRSIAMQIASGLEAAHEKGLVHRDLKPANVMLTPDGDVKILDFGLARAWFGEMDDEDLATSPTITAAMTQAGTILGTAAYMSPEQARGKNVDRRADIWAFGVILWELLVGEQLFEGETVSDTLAAVLRATPDWSRLPAEDEPALCRLVERCLVRDPRERLRDIGEARILLADPPGVQSHLSVVGLPVPMDAPVARRTPWPTLGVAALVGLVVGGVLAWQFLSPTPTERAFRLMIPAPEGIAYETGTGAPGPPVVSPDERMVAFTGRDADQVIRLYLRHLDQADAVELPGTENAAYPFWSPDSDVVAFFDPTANKLRKIAVGGGPPVTLCDAVNGKGGSWNRDGVILFAPDSGVALWRVPATGGVPSPVTELGEGVNSHRHPRFLPDGDRFLYLARTSQGVGEIWMGSLSGQTPQKITESQAPAEYSAGNLLTVLEDVLMASPFDPKSGELSPDRIPLVDELMVLSSGDPGAAFAALYGSSPAGMLVFQTGLLRQERTLQLVDLDGGGRLPLGEPGQLHHPEVSPDGERAVIEIHGEGGIADLWLVDLATGLRSRFSFSEADEARALWTPDGRAVIYAQSEGDVFRIVRQPVEGTGGAEILHESPIPVSASSVHPDGSRLLMNLSTEGGQAADVYELDLTGDGGIREVVVAPGVDAEGRYSPDGRWIAYMGESSTRWDAYVIAADGGRRKWQVSTGGTVYPHWSADGTRILAQTLPGTVVAYEVDGTGETFRVGSSEVLVQAEASGPEGCTWSPHPDGVRLLEATTGDPDASRVSMVQLVTDWPQVLGR